MRVTKKGGRSCISIDPGELYVTRQNEVISTLLGSCVAACLYDPLNRVIGMNHFLLANRSYNRKSRVLESRAGRYGIHAMELLVEAMLKKGALKHHLKAKVFGGGEVLHGHRGERDDFFFVGEVNSRFVLKFLERERIPIEAKDLGEDFGRVIYFTANDYSVYLRRISHSLNAKVAEMEHRFWVESIKARERGEVPSRSGRTLFRPNRR